jgi:site-specific recombinase XerD
MSKSMMVAESPGVYLTGGAGRQMMEWSQLMKLRPAILKQSKMPMYLLLPEVRALLTTMRDANTHLLFSTLWHTGARITEALALTRSDFERDPPLPYVSIKTLKQKNEVRRGIVRVPSRVVPIRDASYLDELNQYIALHKPKPGERLFPISRQAAAVRLNKAVANYEEVTGKELSIKVTPHTFRHSFATNAVLHGAHLVAIQKWLGHAQITSTLIYTNVLGFDTGHQMAWISF